MDTTELLLAQLMQGYAGQGDPRRDPFSPTQAGVDAGDANAAVEGTGHSAESEQWAKEFADELGIDHKELLKPASGPIAERLGVAGVTPDFGALKKAMLNIVKGHEDMAKQGGAPGGPAPENPQLRSALAYQQLQQSGQRLGGLGGQLINNLGPLIGPRMVAPYLEQQQQAAQQAAQLKTQLLIADTASKGALRAAQTRKTLADEEMSQAKMLHLGDKKYKLNGTPSTGGFVFDPETGDIIHQIEPAPKGKSLLPPKPFNKQDKDGNTYRYSYKTYDDMWSGAEPDRKDLVKPAGSAGERKDLAELYTLADKSLQRVQDLYEDGFTGPIIGRALSARKTGNALTQPLGSIVSQGLLSPERLTKALEFRAEVENANQALNLFFTGKASSEQEWNRRRAALGTMTDYPADFLSSIASSKKALQDRRAEKERLLGVDIVTGNPIEKKPLESGFIGKPSTGGRSASQGVIVDKYMGELQKDYGLE